MSVITHDKHGHKLTLHRTRRGTLSAVKPPRLSLFQRVTDWVSWAEGTPANIMFWIVVVALWAGFGPYIAQHPFLPGFMNSNAWNFPLNTGESTAELYIGFLVAAAANRSERNLEATLTRMEQLETGVSRMLTGFGTLLNEVAGLVRDMRDVVTRTHAMQEQQMTILDNQGAALGALTHINAELNLIRQAVAPAAANPAAGADPAPEPRRSR